MATTGPIATFGSLVGGSGYANGTFNNVALAGGNGTGAAANLTVSGGAVTAITLPNPSVHQVLDRVGKNYQLSDPLVIADPGFDGVGAGSGFAVIVATLANACENCLYGRIVPLSAGPNMFGKRYCSNNAYQNKSDKAFALQLLAGRAPYQDDATFLTSHSWEAMICADDFVCGDGASLATLNSFSQGVNSLPQTTISSTFAGPLGVNTQVASYTLVLGDNNFLTQMNVSSANTLTVPPHSSVAFPVGTSWIQLAQTGTGQTTITPGGGVTINSRVGLKMSGQYAVASLYQPTQDTWVASGDLQL